MEDENLVYLISTIVGLLVSEVLPKTNMKYNAIHEVILDVLKGILKGSGKEVCDKDEPLEDEESI